MLKADAEEQSFVFKPTINVYNETERELVITAEWGRDKNGPTLNIEIKEEGE